MGTQPPEGAGPATGAGGPAGSQPPIRLLHVLKIDRQFVTDLLVNDASRYVVEAVVSLARGFGLTIIAEGVEDQATLERLVEHGVDFSQGFHTGRPAPVEELTAPSTVRE